MKDFQGLPLHHAKLPAPTSQGLVVWLHSCSFHHSSAHLQEIRYSGQPQENKVERGPTETIVGAGCTVAWSSCCGVLGMVMTRTCGGTCFRIMGYWQKIESLHKPQGASGPVKYPRCRLFVLHKQWTHVMALCHISLPHWLLMDSDCHGGIPGLPVPIPVKSHTHTDG